MLCENKEGGLGRVINYMFDDDSAEIGWSRRRR